MNPTLESSSLSPRPRAFALELTKNCNLRCGYCYYADRESAYDPRTAMSRDVAEQSVEMLLRDGPSDGPLHLHLFGGEPLLNFPLLSHVVEYAERRGRETGRVFTFELTTNGTRFDEHAIEFLNAHRIHVGVSFDGPPEVQDASRPGIAGTSSSTAALPGIRRFLASRAGTDLELETHCTMVITRRDLDLVRIASYAESLGFRRIILEPATDLEGRNHGLRPEDLPQILAAYDALADDAERRLAEGRPLAVTWFSVLLGRLTSGERRTSFCQGGLDYLGVAADGSVSLCYRFYEAPEYGMGSVQTSIDRNVTERLQANPVDERTECSKCWARHFCGGGCHHENLMTTGNLGDPNPVTCEILRHGMDRTLDMWKRLDRPREPVAQREVHAMTSEISWDAQDVPRREPEVHLREADGEQILYVPKTHQVVVLNPTAKVIFGLCDGNRTVAQILDVLKGRFAAPEERLHVDLRATLARLADKGALGR